MSGFIPETKKRAKCHIYYVTVRARCPSVTSFSFQDAFDAIFKVTFLNNKGRQCFVLEKH